jgi:hypothetical protein
VTATPLEHGECQFDDLVGGRSNKYTLCFCGWLHIASKQERNKLLRGFHMAIMSSDQLVIIPTLTAGPFAESFKHESRWVVLGDSRNERLLDLCSRI